LEQLNMPAIPLDEARRRVAEHLVGFPESVTEDYLRYAQSGDANTLDRVVLGVVHFYQATPSLTPLIDLPTTTRLREDLGCDSLTMVEVAFLAESLLGVKLPDEELERLLTLGDLRDFFRRVASAA
jgi:acyl carrier protein